MSSSYLCIILENYVDEIAKSDGGFKANSCKFSRELIKCISNGTMAAHDKVLILVIKFSLPISID
jgi:hypothetical protein